MMPAWTPFRAAAARGALAGVGGSVVQTGVGLLLDKLVLPRRQHNNIAPRLVKRLTQWTGRRSDARRDWALGTLFHLGYGVGWGVLFSLTRRWLQLSPWPHGALTGGLIYALAFSSRGVASLTATEPPPRRRSWRKQLSLAAVAWAYAFATALFDEALARRRVPGRA